MDESACFACSFILYNAQCKQNDNPMTILPPYAIAYTRVSSRSQYLRGESLAEQRLAIETFAQSVNIHVEEWFEEIGSAYGRDSVTKRPQFNAAVERAIALKVPLIVASFDRLSRDLKSFSKIIEMPGLTLISAQEGMSLTVDNLKAKIARGEAESKRKSDSAKKEHARRKALGLPPRNPDLDGARSKSADVRGAQAQANADHLENILRRDPSLKELSLQMLADRLNELGHRDLRGKSWTKNSVYAAKQRFSKLNDTVPASRSLSAQELADLEDHKLMLKNPHYGIF